MQAQLSIGPAGLALKQGPTCSSGTCNRMETAMGAPSPDLCNLWLARAFNAQDTEAAAALYHPDAAIVQVDQVHGGTRTARGAQGIRDTMARSEEHTSELQSLMRISYAVFCLKKKHIHTDTKKEIPIIQYT